MANAYYEPKDLADFPNIGEYAKDEGEKFFEYYGKRIQEEWMSAKHSMTFLALVYAVVIGVGPALAQATEDSVQKDKMMKMYVGYRDKSFPDIKEITVEQLLSLPDSVEVVVVDAREEKEQKVSLIPGAITADSLEKAKRQHKEHKVVIYCTIGYRSGIYAKKMAKKGFDTYNLVGGVLAWAHAGKNFVSDSSTTKRVHVYGKDWDLCPGQYQSVW